MTWYHQQSRHKWGDRGEYGARYDYGWFLNEKIYGKDRKREIKKKKREREREVLGRLRRWEEKWEDEWGNLGDEKREGERF